MIDNLSEEQLAAVTSRDSRYSVRAAAGSGKTRVITARYLRAVLEEGISPDEILTITFTKAAAAEMRERIVSALQAAGRMDLAQIAQTGPITTIHSFCDRLLRENSLAAGVDPEFEMYDEIDADFTQKDALRRVILDRLDELPEALAYFRRSAGLRSPGRRATAPKLEKNISTALEKMRGSGVPLEEWREAFASVDALDRRVRQALLSALPTDWQAELIGSRADFYTILAQNRQLKRPAWMTKVTPEQDADALQVSCGLGQISVAVWEELDAWMNTHQKFDFTSLEWRAVNLLESSLEARETVGRQYRILLADEAQDINPVQYRLLDAIVVQQQIMVGDGQQAIYGFRGSSPKLFHRRTEELPVLPLTKNYRTRAGILRFVDACFKQRWPHSYVEMAPPLEIDPEDPFSRLQPQVDGVDWLRFPANSDRKSAEWVAQLVQEGEPAGDIAVIVRTSNQAANIRVALQNLAIPARILKGTERFYTRLVIHDLSNALYALARPEDDYALLATLRSPIAGVSLDTIVLISQNRPVREHLKDFRSPINEDNERLEAFSKWFDDLSRYADRLSAWECLARIFEQTRFMESIASRPTGRQDVANARKLLQLAVNMPDRGPVEFAEFMKDVRDLKHREGEATAIDASPDEVRIVTAHSAKGLEFPVVVLDLGSLGIMKNSVHVNSDFRVISDSSLSSKSQLDNWLTHEQKQYEKSESDRLIYVGMTRAQRRLSIVTTPTGKRESASVELARWIEPLLPSMPGVNIVDFLQPEEDPTLGKLPS